MKIAVACDHGGYEYKEKLVAFLKDLNYEVEDFGCYNSDSVDYPDIIYPCAKSVSEGENDRGIVICGTGIGVSIVANKVKGIRCALVYDPEIAKITREHNDSNMLAMGGRVMNLDTMYEVVKNWLETPFSNDERHIRRIKKISELEK